ncbi:MAG: tRNA 2-thiouridine(34) synthase MnmA [Synergistaceae bacterium]|nr:tRNA 2-thiouridine(34) synthase MnmA [Synergistaceae bacterium]
MTVKKALIAMSGGVDSSVAAFMMREQGYECMGAMMKLYTNEDAGVPRENGCCSLFDAEDARSVAYRLDIPFYVFNFTQYFTQEVIKRFIGAYQNGRTPNPCIDCNRFVKFKYFLQRARELDMDCIATGHYVRTEKDGERFLLKKGVDGAKDQSYVLYAMTQAQLARAVFPLGGMTKDQVREVARDAGFANARKSDSQDICFVPGGGYANFIERYTGTASEPGRFVDARGNDLGGHKGIVHYTIGQRKGLGLPAAEPMFVREIHAGSNSVVVGTSEELYSKSLTACDVNLIPFEKIDKPMKIRAKIRYKQPEQPATAWQTDADTLRIEFDVPQKAITKGQAVVLYDGDVVIGGGTIDEVETKRN